MKKIISLLLLFNLMFFNTGLFSLADTIQKEYKYPVLSEYYINNDIYEKINRKIFNANLALNRVLIKKIHIFWASLLPNFLINSLNLAYSNIEYPKKAISALLQRDVGALKHETKRFLVNTTLGLAGLLDVADKLFKLEPYFEDMEQAFAKCKFKCGKYFVLPFLSSTTTRDIFGRIFDFALNPTTYIATPIAAAIKAGLLINRTAYIQPLIKMIESGFADPYDIAREFFGVEKYIKLSNFDRKNVLEKMEEKYVEEIELVDNSLKENLHVKGKISESENLIVNLDIEEDLNADILLSDYKPQNPVLDSLRTALFDLKIKDKSIWHEISIWNRKFEKKIKTASIEVVKNRPKYTFRYLLQKDKNSPLAIIFPSIGEGVFNTHNNTLARLFYSEGYSVVLMSSHFQWEFLNSMEKGYKPGVMKDDVKYINLAIGKIIKYLSKKHDRNFLKRTVFGTSLGAFAALFVANEQYELGAQNIDEFIAVCPPIELLFAIEQVDKIIESWKNYPDDFKEKIALVAAKTIRAFKDKDKYIAMLDSLPFSNYEAKLISAFVFHQKLSDLIYSIETDKNPNIDKQALYSLIHKMNYGDYMEKYFLVNYSKEELKNLNSLKSISNYLINADNYKIYHSLDDYLANKTQLKELKSYCDEKLVLFSNGAHLGFLYRDEFINELKKEIKPKNKTKS